MCEDDQQIRVPASYFSCVVLNTVVDSEGLELHHAKQESAFDVLEIDDQGSDLLQKGCSPGTTPSFQDNLRLPHFPRNSIAHH